MTFYDLEIGPGFWTVLVISLVVGITAMVFFLLNLRGLLLEVRPQNRAMQPNHVWLNLIPIFSLVWMIITVIKVRDSARAEFQARGWSASGDFGFGVGLAFAILSIVGGGFLLIVWLACWVIYWLKTADLKRQFQRSQGAGGWSAPAPPPATPTHSPVADAREAVASEAQAGVESSGAAEDTTAEPTAGSQMICPVCGVENRENAKFCRSCGRSF